MIEPAFVTINAFRGLPLRLTLTLYQDSARTTPVDVTGWDFAAQIRALPGAPVQATATVTILDATGGTVEVVFAAAATTALAGTRLEWDLVGEDASGVQRVCAEGSVGVRDPISTIS